MRALVASAQRIVVVLTLLAFPSEAFLPSSSNHNNNNNNNNNGVYKGSPPPFRPFTAPHQQQRTDGGGLRKTMMTTTATTTTLKLSLVIEVGAVAVLGFAAWLYVDGADDRAWRKRRQDEDARYQEYQDQRAQQAYIEPKDYWTLEELRAYDGKANGEEDGPILLAADGWVFNVYKGRNFYGPGAEYHVMAGRDATRLLAKTRLEEETEHEAAQPLTLAERAALAGWMFTLKNKYEIVGKLEGFDPSTTALK